MNVKQQAEKNRKMKKQSQELRNKLWGEIDPEMLWDTSKSSKKSAVGYVTIPRTMPIIFEIMDDLSNGKPVSKVYFGLWCRVFNHSFLEIQNMEELAFEAGFSGQRSVPTWKSRMKALKELGFIDIKEGKYGEYSYVLIYNPYKIIKDKEKEVQEKKYNALFARAQEISATDLE